MSHEFAMPEGTIKVRYESRTIPLAFGIQLDDFIERSYPGIAMAASYESHVQVLPEHGEPFSKKIYMNNPLKYAGYTFYQASFQRTPEGEITVLSVAQDPGMTVSFVGYCILVAGLLLIFFVKPALRRLDDRIARSRAAGGSA
jgi:cytochrome c biogenesis protein ResB